MQPTSHHQPLFVVMAHQWLVPSGILNAPTLMDHPVCLGHMRSTSSSLHGLFFLTPTWQFSVLLRLKLVDPFFSGGFGQILWRGLQSETVEPCGNRFSACHIFIWGEEKQRGLPTLRPYLDPEGWNLCGYIHVPTGWSFCFFDFFWLFGRNCNASIRPRGEYTFQLVKHCFSSHFACQKRTPPWSVRQRYEPSNSPNLN